MYCIRLAKPLSSFLFPLREFQLLRDSFNLIGLISKLSFTNMYCRYMFLAISVVSAYTTYASYVANMLIGGQSEGKSIYAFVLDIAHGLIHFYMNVTFLYIAFV